MKACRESNPEEDLSWYLDIATLKPYESGIRALGRKEMVGLLVSKDVCGQFPRYIP